MQDNSFVVECMGLTTRVMRLLRNMVCHKSWGIVNKDRTETR